MTKDNLGKLARLTRGAALVGIGAAALGCSKTDVTAQPHASASADGTSEDSGAADAAPAVFRRRLPIPNAIPNYYLRLLDAGGTNDGGAAQR